MWHDLMPFAFSSLTRGLTAIARSCAQSLNNGFLGECGEICMRWHLVVTETLHILWSPNLDWFSVGTFDGVSIHKCVIPETLSLDNPEPWMILIRTMIIGGGDSVDI
jgi:hypothetical protein